MTSFRATARELIRRPGLDRVGIGVALAEICAYALGMTGRLFIQASIVFGGVAGATIHALTRNNGVNQS